MDEDKFDGVSFFKTADKKIYAIIDDSREDLEPLLPIACLNTGVGHDWKDFDDAEITKIKFVLPDAGNLTVRHTYMKFGELPAGALFSFCDSEGEKPEIGVKLFGDPLEKNMAKMISSKNGYFLALRLSNRQLRFGIHALFDFVSAMMNWPVKKIDLPLEVFTKEDVTEKP